MADQDQALTALIDDFKQTSDAAHLKAKRRIGLTAVLIVFAGAYMGWIYSGISKLDANAVSEIARAEVQSRLPELGAHLTQVANDAAPQVMDRGEEALLSAPSLIRAHVQDQLLSQTGEIIDTSAAQLDAQLQKVIGEHIAELTRDGGKPTLDEMMQTLRADYRKSVAGMSDQLYIGYAKEIQAVEALIVRLRTADDLTPQERNQKEIIEATVALRRHFIEPIEVTEQANASQD